MIGMDKNMEERGEHMRKRLYEFVAVSLPIIVITAIIIAGSVNAAFAQGTGGGGQAVPQTSVKQPAAETKTIIIAIAVMIATAMLSAGYAVGKVGSAALGAVSERPELFGRSILFVGLAEGIAIWGFVVSVLLYTKI